MLVLWTIYPYQSIFRRKVASSRTLYIAFFIWIVSLRKVIEVRKLCAGDADAHCWFPSGVCRTRGTRDHELDVVREDSQGFEEDLNKKDIRTTSLHTDP